MITFSITDLKTNTLIHGARFDGKFHDLFEQQSVMIDRIASNLYSPYPAGRDRPAVCPPDQ